MHVYIYAYMHIYIYTYIHINIYTYITHAGIYRPHRGVTVAVCSDGVTLDRMNTEAGAVGAERVCTVAPSAQAGEKEYSTCAW